MLYNPHNLTHSVIQDSDGRYEVKLYQRGRWCGGANSCTSAKTAIEEAYAFYLKKNPVCPYT